MNAFKRVIQTSLVVMALVLVLGLVALSSGFVWYGVFKIWSTIL